MELEPTSARAARARRGYPSKAPGMELEPTSARAARARRGYQRDLSADREVRRFEAGLPDRGERLDRFLAARLRWASRARIQGWIESGRVDVRPSDTRRRRASLRLRGDEVVSISLDAPHLDAPHLGAARPVAAASLLVLHEDPWLLAVSKPPACNVHPTRRHLAGSLVELVHRRERDLAPADRQAESWLPSPCHRLDRDTSGVVLFARDPRTRAAVGRQIEARAVRKRYLAWVRGEVRGEAGEIALEIGADPSSALANRRAVCARGAGRPALTRWRALRRWSGMSLLELEPVTGRTHQLRVHLSAIGHPILGDPLYRDLLPGDEAGGDALFLRSLRGLSPGDATELFGHFRLALHALRLELEHPALGTRLELEAPLPPDLVALSAA